MQLLLESCLVSTGANMALTFLPLEVAASHALYARQEHSPCIRSLLAPPLASRPRKDLSTAHGILHIEQLFCPSAICMVMLNYPLLKAAE